MKITITINVDDLVEYLEVTPEFAKKLLTHNQACLEESGFYAVIETARAMVEELPK